MPEPNAEEMLEALTEAIAAVLRADEPHWAAVELSGLANSSMTEFGLGYRLWWMWSALTDWYELKARGEARSGGDDAPRRR